MIKQFGNETFLDNESSSRSALIDFRELFQTAIATFPANFRIH